MNGSPARKLGRLVANLLANPGTIPRYVSSIKKQPLAAELPWFSFGAIDYLDRWLKPEMRVFEFGCGGSTIWFARRVGHVRSVEENKEWLDRVSDKLMENHISNVNLSLEELNSSDFVHSRYVQAVVGLDADLIVVDGSDVWPAGLNRRTCFAVAERNMKPGNVIVVDDSWVYSDLRQSSCAKRVMTFKGVGPCRIGVTSTDIFFY